MLVLELALGLALGASPAGAQRAGEGDQAEAAPAQNLDAVTARILGEAIELYNMGDFAGARAKLAELNFEKLSPYERARVEQLLAAMAFSEEKYSEAREHLELAIASGGLNTQELSSNRFQVAQSYMGEENWARAAATLESWLETAANPNSAAYYMLAAAYYQQGAEATGAAAARPRIGVGSGVPHDAHPPRAIRRRRPGRAPGSPTARRARRAPRWPGAGPPEGAHRAG